MPSGKATTIEKWADYLAMRRQGISLYAASKHCGLSYHACRDAESGKAPRNYLAAEEALGKRFNQKFLSMTFFLLKLRMLTTTLKFLLKDILGLFFSLGKLRLLNASWVSSTQTLKSTQ